MNFLISDRSPGDVVVLSLAEQIEIDLPEPRQDHGVLETDLSVGLLVRENAECSRVPAGALQPRAFGHYWT